MEERTVRVVLGDWSEDGHGKTETVLVRLKGEDLSDEALASSYLHRVEELGVDLATVCEEYEDSSISEEYYEELQRAGFRPSLAETYPSIRVESYRWDAPKVHFPAVELLMFYVGATVENFQWELVADEAPILIGGGHTILRQRSHWSPEGSHTTSFGYGLFL